MNADGVAAHLCSSIPAMLIACKSDPGVELAISPFQGNDIGQPHQIGLVELSMQVQEGRHKMRMAFSWLLKTISKKRRESHHVVCDDGCWLMRGRSGQNEKQARALGLPRTSTSTDASQPHPIGQDQPPPLATSPTTADSVASNLDRDHEVGTKSRDESIPVDLGQALRDASDDA